MLYKAAIVHPKLKKYGFEVKGNPALMLYYAIPMADRLIFQFTQKIFPSELSKVF